MASADLSIKTPQQASLIPLPASPKPRRSKRLAIKTIINKAKQAKNEALALTATLQSQVFWALVAQRITTEQFHAQMNEISTTLNEQLADLDAIINTARSA